MNKKKYLSEIYIRNNSYTIFDINLIDVNSSIETKHLPFSIKILMENLLRNMDGKIVKEKDLANIAGWKKEYHAPIEIPFHPARVLMQDFTGVPAIVDFAAMRDAVHQMGKDPSIINPLVPVDLIIDHSVQVDYYGTSTAIEKNVNLEYKRNKERYSFLKWAQTSFNNLNIIPPNSGICHQINLEYIGKGIRIGNINGSTVLYPDTLVGTDSHTTMINAIGVMGWGVGGIEAEAVMLGQPYYMAIPQVIGVRLYGKVKEGITSTDIVLTITQFLRKHDVVGKFVEFFGPGVNELSVPDRATISNMAPEYGATVGFFPTDEKIIEYFRLTRNDIQAEIIEKYTKLQGLFYDGRKDAEYTRVLDVDLSLTEPCIAGPSKPQARIPLKDIRRSFDEILKESCETEQKQDNISGSYESSWKNLYKEAFFKPACPVNPDFGIQKNKIKISDGSIVIAAITSCTNTSNPYVLLGAGLLAKNAVKAGIRVSPFIKTSFVPGSKVVVRYLKKSGLLFYLEALGFHVAGYGCATCIGNSGPLHPGIENIISEKGLTVAAVLSGNRNFEARINQHVRANFLMSPMLVVAFALAGKININFFKEPIGFDPNCDGVYLKKIWPSSKEIKKLVKKYVSPEDFKVEYNKIYHGDEFWEKLESKTGKRFNWNPSSTYIKLPPYFNEFSENYKNPSNIDHARVLLVLGDTVTTDHISPAGAIPEQYPAGAYLKNKNVNAENFNTYGSRRGNHDIMIRGTFGNIRIKNKLVSGQEGSYTLKFPENKKMFIYEAAEKYQKEKIPLIVFAGKEYGIGSSRDWAAKGTRLLGIRAVIAESFERIHRSNLVGMGVLPLQFRKPDNIKTLGINGTEQISISGISDICPGKELNISAEKNGTVKQFKVIARLDTEIEVEYYRHSGILHYVLQRLIK